MFLGDLNESINMKSPESSSRQDTLFCSDFGPKAMHFLQAKQKLNFRPETATCVMCFFRSDFEPKEKHLLQAK